jgi:hypothetical protein
MALIPETSASADIQRKVDRKRDGLVPLRPISALTASYVATGHLDCSQAENINLYFILAWVGSTSISYYIEWSYDATTWFRSINVSPSAGTNTITMNENVVAVTAVVNWVDTYKRQAPFMRVQIKEAGATDTITIFANVTSL